MIILKKMSFRFRWICVLLIIVNIYSCEKKVEKTSSINTQALNEEEHNNINQDYKDLYSCFQMVNLLKEEQHYLLIAGQELGIIDAFFFKSNDKNENYTIDAFKFKLIENQDKSIFNDVCKINHIVYNKVAFTHLKKFKLQESNSSMLENFKDFKPESHLGKFDPFFITLCEYSYEKEIYCLTVYKDQGSLLEKFYNQILSQGSLGKYPADLHR